VKSLHEKKYAKKQKTRPDPINAINKKISLKCLQILIYFYKIYAFSYGYP